MNRLKEHYDLIAVAVLIAALAFAPAAPEWLDPSLHFVTHHQSNDHPTLVVVDR